MISMIPSVDNDKWDNFIKSFAASSALLLGGYLILWRYTIPCENKCGDDQASQLERRRQSWLLTLMASILLTAISIPYIVSLIYHFEFDMSKYPLVRWPTIDIAVHAFFAAYLALDLIVGCWHYHDQIQLVSGWIHHSLYVLLALNLVHLDITAPLPCFTIMELPTIVLATGHVWKAKRSDILFGVCFLVTRLVYHSWLIYQFYFKFPLSGWWMVVLGAFLLHCHWFGCWVRRMKRLF